MSLNHRRPKWKKEAGDHWSRTITVGECINLHLTIHRMAPRLYSVTAQRLWIAVNDVRVLDALSSSFSDARAIAAMHVRGLEAALEMRAASGRNRG